MVLGPLFAYAGDVAPEEGPDLADAVEGDLRALGIVAEGEDEFEVDDGGEGFGDSGEEVPGLFVV